MVASTDVSTTSLLGPRDRRRLRFALVVLAIAGGIYLLRDVAKVFLVAGLIAYLLNPLVGHLQARTDRTTATLTVVGAALAIGAGGTYALGPILQHQIVAIQESIHPQDVLRVVEQLDRQLTDTFGALVGPTDLTGQLEGALSRWRGQIVSGAPALLGVLVNVVLIPFVALFLLRDGPRLKRGLIRFVPNRYFEFALEAIYKVDQQVGNYFRGLLLDVFVVTLLSIGALWALRVESFVLLGVLAGVTTVIPYAGSLLGGGVAVLVHLTSTGDPYAAALVLLVFVIIQVLDEVVIQPLVFAQTVNLHPLEVLLAVWVGAQALGAVGMVVAIPVAGAGKVVVKEGSALIQQYRRRRPPRAEAGETERWTYEDESSAADSPFSPD